MRTILLALVGCVSLGAQTFVGINYLYRADDSAKTKPVFVLGTLAFDAAHKTMTFGPAERTKKQIKQGFPEVPGFEIHGETVSSA